MSKIHPTAIIEDGAILGEDIIIGPYCVISKDALLKDKVQLHSHVVIAGKTTIGAETEIFPFSSIGHAPQDLKYDGEPSEVKIGANNVIREYVTINPGTGGGGMLTSIGDNCLIMINAHVAHDCLIGDNVVMVNNATLGGHVVIDDFAIIGGLSAVHQFVRIGRHAMIGGASGVENDIIPFGSATGNRANLNGLNLVGMKRRGFSRDDIHGLRNAYKYLFSEEDTLSERVAKVSEQYAGNKPVTEVVNFLTSESKRGICQP